MQDPSEKLTIATPEQTHLEFVLAGIGSRFMAFFYDTLIQIVVIILMVIVAGIIMDDLGRYWPSAWNWAAALWIFAFFLLYWGYFAIFETIWNGQTPGKRHTGIRVIKDSGRAITPFEAIARNFIRVVDMIPPPTYGVGTIAMFLNRSNKRLGDMVAGTVVIHERTEEGLLFPSAATPAIQLNASQSTQLSSAELDLIETFLQRRIDLAPELRAVTAHRIATRIAERLGVPPPPDRPENFLETVAWEARKSAGYR